MHNNHNNKNVVPIKKPLDNNKNSVPDKKRNVPNILCLTIKNQTLIIKNYVLNIKYYMPNNKNKTLLIKGK